MLDVGACKMVLIHIIVLHITPAQLQVPQRLERRRGRLRRQLAVQLLGRGVVTRRRLCIHVGGKWVGGGSVRRGGMHLLVGVRQRRALGTAASSSQPAPS